VLQVAPTKLRHVLIIQALRQPAHVEFHPIYRPYRTARSRLQPINHSRLTSSCWNCDQNSDAAISEV